MENDCYTTNLQRNAIPVWNRCVALSWNWLRCLSRCKYLAKSGGNGWHIQMRLLCALETVGTNSDIVHCSGAADWFKWEKERMSFTVELYCKQC